jgi:hypothetical protein
MKVRDFKTLFVGIFFGGLALASFLTTVYMYLNKPENRAYFIKKLENIRNEPVFPKIGEKIGE